MGKNGLLGHDGPGVRSRCAGYFRSGSTPMKAVACIGSLIAAGLLSGCSSLAPVALLKDPLNVQEHTSLAQSYEANKEFQLAEAHYRAALRQDRHDRTALLALG